MWFISYAFMSIFTAVDAWEWFSNLNPLLTGMCLLIHAGIKVYLC